MISCFLCHNSFEVNLYFKHLKYFHKLVSTSKFLCTCCPQTFQSSYSFKRHILKQHNDFGNSLPQLINVQNITEKIESNTYIPLINNNHKDYLSNLKADLPKLQLSINIPRFIMKLYGRMSLSRQLANDIIADLQSEILGPLVDELQKYFNYPDDILSRTNISQIVSQLCQVKETCENFNSEYKFKKYLREKNLYSDPEEFIIDNSIALNNINLGPSRGVVLPLRDNLKRYLEIPGVLQSMFKNMAVLNQSNNIENIINGSTWKKKMLNFENKIVLPYIIYQDDFEVNNPLGSKRGIQKISAFYLSFPLLESGILSKLENILVCCLTRSIHLKHGSESNFGAFCSQLLSLEDGLTVLYNNKPITLHLVLAAITGDNLGLNTVLGYSRSFSSNYFCRICKIHKEQMKWQTREVPSSLRCEENYNADISNADPSNSGIREPCTFSKLNSFSVTDNVTVDIMHDILEGICHIELSLILKNFILDENFFSLAVLNSRKANFKYSKKDSNNLSVDISMNHLNNQKFQMSASEMLCFITFIPVIIGDFVPVNNKVWLFLLLLIRLVDLCFEPSYNEKKLREFEEVITSHHKMFLGIFKERLIPKHHFILHYPNVIRKLGPLKKLWSMRFEAKHRALKMYASVITSRKNICLSIAFKLQFDFAYKLSFGEESKKYMPGPKEDSELLNFRNMEFDNTALTTDELNNVYFVKYIDIYNTMYKKKDIVALEENNSMKFYLIQNILEHTVKGYFLIGNEALIKRFDPHYNCYVISGFENHNKLINFEDIKYLPVNEILLPNKEKVLRLKPPIL